MMLSIFSTVSVNAAAQKGMALSGSLSKDGKTITIVVTAVGTEPAINSFQISLNIPDGATESNITAIGEKSLIMGITNGILNVGFLDMTGNGAIFTNNKIATIKITLPEALDEDYVVTLQSESTIEDANGEVKVGSGTMDAASVTIKKWSGS